MVYFPPNPSTGLNGHFSLVTSPQQHHESAADATAVAASTAAMQESWQNSSWASQSASSNCHLMDNQHYTVSAGFTTPTEAEMALGASGEFQSNKMKE